ncbi:hypothetical protein PVK06_011915 [Gossypium arboreum]|uniref:Uncharacterized protein n=1 Tax=Gossypium arboreum TaxID=29729 RepID=A0ABR0QAC2_GOSAR|nr:hypothetical protein PVK06_011915 [Gossypium arboreum]
MDATMKKMVEKHHATISKIGKEQKVAMVSSEQRQAEALEIVGGPFDARRVDFDAFCNVTNDQLDFDIHFPFGAA